MCRYYADLATCFHLRCGAIRKIITASTNRHVGIKSEVTCLHFDSATSRLLSFEFYNSATNNAILLNISSVKLKTFSTLFSDNDFF